MYVAVVTGLVLIDLPWSTDAPLRFTAQWTKPIALVAGVPALLCAISFDPF
jgi:hypothetical protein